MQEHGELECCGSRVLMSSSSVGPGGQSIHSRIQLTATEIGRGNTSPLPILASPPTPHQKEEGSVVCRCWIGQKNRSAVLASE